MGVMWLINTVLGYKKGSKTKNNTTDFENIMSQLSNALSIVLISLKMVEILRIEFFSVAPPEWLQTLLLSVHKHILTLMSKINIVVS